MADATSSGTVTGAAARTGRISGLLARRGELPRWLVLVLGIVLACLVVPPLIYLLISSMTTRDITGTIESVTIQNYGRVLQSPQTLTSITNTAIYAAGSASIALFLGGTQALIVERTNTPLRNVAYLVAVVSLSVPYVLYTVAWLLLLGREGPVNHLIGWLLGTAPENPVIDVNSLAGMILVEGLLWSPLAFLMLAASFRNTNASLEEAAQMAGATIRKTLLRITLPLSTPAILAILLLMLIRTVESFEVPALIGLPGGVNVLTTDIFLSIKQRTPPDYGYASAFSVVMLVMVAVLLYFYGRLSRSSGKYASIIGKSQGAKRIDLGAWRFAGTAFILVSAFVILILPLIILLWTALQPYYTPFSTKALSRLTAANFRTAVTAAGYVSDIRNTLLLAAGAATIVLALAGLSAWLAARRAPGGSLLDYLATMPLIIPGMVLGVAVLSLYISVPLPIYGTLWILLIAFVIRYVPYGMRYSYAGVLQVSEELEESGRVSGARPLTVFRRIVTPLILPSLGAGWFFVFLLAARELTMAILLSTAGSSVVAVRLYDLWENGMTTELAAVGLLWSAIMTVAAVGCYLLAKRARVDLY